MLGEVRDNVKDLKGEREGLKGEEVLSKLSKIDSFSDIRRHANRYVQGTRLPIFEEIERWLDDIGSPNRVMVISGNAGMGKSVISAVFCEKMLKAGRLSGCHFCQHNNARRRNPKVMLQSLACQLSDSLPEYRKTLVEKLSRNLGVDINDMEVGDLFELLFEESLEGLDDPGSTHLLVIDGLDESEYQGRNELLNVISDGFKKLPHWIRFLVSTRPEINISEKLQELNPIQLKPTDVENLKDIKICFKKKLVHVLEGECHEIILEKLIEKSEGVMLYTYYLVDLITKNSPSFSLDELLKSGLPSGLSSVYQVYFKRLETELQEKLGITEDNFFDFLNAIVAAREPLPVDFVYKLFLSKEWSPADQRKVRASIECISALLPIEGECIHLFHKSIKDWLIGSSSQGPHRFSVDKTRCNSILSKLCTDELDGVKRKGVDGASFNCSTKYALKHGVQHLLELEEDLRPHSLEEIVINYVSDVELVYAKLCVDSFAALEDILSIQKENRTGRPVENFPRADVLENLLLLLRKHIVTLTELPRTIFQTCLNEGGTLLSSEARNLLQTTFSDIPYMEQLLNGDNQGLVETWFQCSHKVSCFDVSPQLDLIVCQCFDNVIQLWSLETGKLLWERRRQEPVEYLYPNNALKGVTSHSVDICGFYRSVVFHPTENVVLPGELRKVYTFTGVRKPLYPSSQCSFSVCSVSQEEMAMLTDCPDNAKCIIKWSLTDGSEITRFVASEDILTFAWSRGKNLLAISDSAGLISLVDTTTAFKILSQTQTPHYCGMIKFSPDCRFLFCKYFDSMNLTNHQLACFHVKKDSYGNPSLDALSELVSYNPWEFESCSESGFLLGDPIWYPRAAHIYHFLLGSSVGISSCLFTEFPKLAFVLNEKSLLRASPNSDVIELVNIDELTKDRAGFKKAFKEGEIYSLTTLKSELTTLRTGFGEATETNMAFSVSGDTVYVSYNRAVEAWDPFSGKLKARRNYCSFTFQGWSVLAAVKDGVLLTSTGEYRTSDLELWNSELTACIRSWKLGKIFRLSGITDERVVLTMTSGETAILDTTSGEIVRKVRSSLSKFVTCNSQCQMICSKSYNSLQLIQCDDSVLWEVSISISTLLLSTCTFSPNECFFAVLGRTWERNVDIFVIDAVSGRQLNLLRAFDGQPFLIPESIDGKFVSDKEFLVARGFFVRLVNVKSGDLLSVISMDNKVHNLTVCPRNRLVGIRFEKERPGFKVIQVKAGNKDSSKEKKDKNSREERRT
ncbi:uncharacterized protein LOC111325966 [Stylophora pistillata]|nr:uncharacterized protein LOC111325966 [Stylophora pistillata]